MMARVRTVLFSIVFWGATVPIVVAAPAAALLGTPFLRRYVLSWLKLHRWCAHHLLGIRTVIEGQLPTAPALYAARHEAMYETFELTRILQAPAIVMKRELARIPMWGWAARRYGVIVVDRAASASALRGLIREAQAAKAEGRSVVIFPEGTRVPHGQRAPIQPGFAGLYKALNLPLIAVALDSGRRWPKRGPKLPGPITFRFAEPLAPGLSRPDVERSVADAINALNDPRDQSPGERRPALDQ
jgi:1-acyl-sn-glycerol-3-phosphate acyltransferase